MEASTESWYSTGAAEAEKMQGSGSGRRPRNFYLRKGEKKARIRFLTRPTESFNYKRAFIPKAQGQKLLTSPQTPDDPIVRAGYNLQAAFAWPIIDRREFEYEDEETGEKKSSKSRVLFFADGQRTRKQLLVFEKEMLEAENEQRREDGEKELTIEEYNLTSYDVVAAKESKSPWVFTAMRAKKLSKEDEGLIDESPLDRENPKQWLMDQLKPLPIQELEAIVGGKVQGEEEDSGETYSYSDEEDDTVSFD